MKKINFDNICFWFVVIVNFVAASLLLSLFSPSHAFMQLVGSGAVTGGGACSTPATGNLFNEGFEGTGYDSGKTVTESGTVAEDTARPGTQSPTGLCSESLLVTGEASVTKLTNIDEGTARTDVYVRLYLYFSSVSGVSKGSWVFVANNQSDIYERAAFLQIDTFSGLWIKAEGASASERISLTQDALHVINLHIVKNATSTISVDGGTSYEFTSGNYDIRWYHLGSLSNDGLLGDFYFDILSVSTSSM